MADSALSLYTAEYKTKVAGLNVTLTRTLTEKTVATTSLKAAKRPSWSN